MKLDFGPLRSLFESDDISEIMVNSWNKIFVEHKGMIVETSVRFVDSRQLDELIYSILSFDKKNVTSALAFDGVLPSGERYNITLPPLSLKGPTLTIRKFSKKVLSLDDLVVSDFMSDRAAHFLKSCVLGEVNMMISGGTGSGKTSFLNALASLIPPTQRIVTIEDVPEIKINHPNWIQLQTVSSDKHEMSARACLVNSLRMRPNRIIVGECRRDEAFDMLQAMNTGHDGSMTTIHASSSIEALSRLEGLVLSAQGDLPQKQVRHLISRALQIVVQIRRRQDGVREITEVTEITGMHGDVISRAPIFERDSSGRLVPTGLVPQCLVKIQNSGFQIHASLFDSKSSGSASNGVSGKISKKTG